MELRQLEIFRVLAEELNFTRTAERVHCVQSNVTVQIRALETELGVPLFERLGKRVQLTEHGRQLVPYTERVLGLLEEAKSGLLSGAEPRGVLRVGAPESVLTYRLPPVLRMLRERYPKIELTFVAQTCSKIWSLLERGAADLAFAINEVPELPNLQVQTLCEEPMGLLAHPDHPLAKLRSVTPADLVMQTLLLTEEDCAYRLKLEGILSSVGLRPTSVLAFSSVEAIKQCAALSLGLAHLPLVTAKEEIASGRLKELGWGGPALSMYTLMAWHKDKWRSAAMNAFLGLVYEHFSAPPRARAKPGKRRSR
jgi:DNA-binding transcriptional LysR family regulator